MGWLRDMMAEAGLRSFGELARRALANPDWPNDSRAQPRSLEAIFGRLDRREDLDWLSDRPGVQQVLSVLLQSQVAEIRSVVLSATASKSLSTRLRLDDLPTARALELQQEALPPTLPASVALPSTWQRLAWIGEPGSGFSIVRHWLLARGLAQAHELESLDEYRELPVQGPPLFLEVSRTLASSILGEFHQRQGVCLAITSGADECNASLERHGFNVVRNAPVAPQLERIVDWAIARSTQGCQSKRDALLSWLTQGPQTWGTLETIGDVLGFVGAYLTLEPTLSNDIDTTTFFARWFSEKVQTLAIERLRDTVTLSRLLPQVLVDIAQSVLLDDQESLLAPRRLEDWLSLVPEQHQRGPDLDWLTTQVGSLPNSIRARDVERAAKRLPPGAHRIIVALRELSLLRPVTPTRFALRPHFATRLLQKLAIDRTINSLPVFWGEALLKPRARAALIDALSVRVSSNPEGLAEDILEVVDAESAALVSALEVSFVLVGLDVLAGGELTESTSQALLEEQNTLLFHGLGPLPLRRTAPLAIERLVDSDGAFYLAAFALTEHQRQQRGTLCPLLDPFHQSAPPAGWGLVLDAVLATVRQAVEERPPWLFGALRLLDRIRQVLGPEDDRNRSPASRSEHAASAHDPIPHPLFSPTVLLDTIELSVFEIADLRSMLEHEGQTKLFIATTEARDKNVGQVLAHLWSLILEASAFDVLPSFIAQLPADFWNAPPTELVVPLLLSPTAEALKVPWHTLPTTFWLVWSTERAKRHLPDESVEAWKAVPSSIGETLARNSAQLPSQIRQVVWQRWPHVGILQIEKHRALQPSFAAAWLADAPSSATETIASASIIHEWQKVDARLRTALARYLHNGLRLRVPGWPMAYDCLQRFERENQRF